MDISLREQVSQAFAERFALEADKLDPNTELQSLGIDSLAMTEFSFVLEDRIGVILPERARYRTLGDVYREAEKAAAAKSRA